MSRVYCRDRNNQHYWGVVCGVAIRQEHWYVLFDDGEFAWVHSRDIFSVLQARNGGIRFHNPNAAEWNQRLRVFIQIIHEELGHEIVGRLPPLEGDSIIFDLP
jgi:hypothetical protein